MRTAIKVDKIALISAIVKIEDKGGLPNLSSLYAAVASEYNKAIQSNVALSEITASVVMLRIEEWDIPIKTIKGKRGRQAKQEITKPENIIVVPEVIPTIPTEVVAPTTIVATEEKPIVLPAITVVHTKPIQSERKIKAKELIAACHGRVSSTDTEITISHPVIIANGFDWNGIVFNSAYAKITIGNGVVKVWKTTSNGEPDPVIENGIQEEVLPETL